MNFSPGWYLHKRMDDLPISQRLPPTKPTAGPGASVPCPGHLQAHVEPVPGAAL
jgi:hypothetical protein